MSSKVEDFANFVMCLICILVFCALMVSQYNKPSEYSFYLINESVMENGGKVYFDTPNDVEFVCQMTENGRAMSNMNKLLEQMKKRNK